MGQTYSRMTQAKFLEDSLYKILLNPFLNTSSHMKLLIHIAVFEDPKSIKMRIKKCIRSSSNLLITLVIV